MSGIDFFVSLKSEDALTYLIGYRYRIFIMQLRDPEEKGPVCRLCVLLSTGKIKPFQAKDLLRRFYKYLITMQNVKQAKLTMKDLQEQFNYHDSYKTLKYAYGFCYED